ncbi:MAG: hypothetical protein CMN78_02855 [Spirochaetales bacterium]|nr:hypothetical protein [Spirochaetales bacterium]
MPILAAEWRFSLNGGIKKKSGYDFPVATIQFQQSLCRCFFSSEAGNAIYYFMAFFTVRAFSVAFNHEELFGMWEIYISF